jgi:hypothetical protein
MSLLHSKDGVCGPCDGGGVCAGRRRLMMEWVVMRVYKLSLGRSLLSSLHLSDSFYSLKKTFKPSHVGLVFLFFKKFLRTMNVRVGQISSFTFSKTPTLSLHGKLLPARSKQNPIPHLHGSNISCLKILKPPHVAFADWLFKTLWSLSWCSILSPKHYQKHSVDKIMCVPVFFFPKE